MCEDVESADLLRKATALVTQTQIVLDKYIYMTISDSPRIYPYRLTIDEHTTLLLGWR